MKLYRLRKLFAEFEYKYRLVVLLKRCFFYIFFMDRVLFKSYRNSKSIESTLISLRNSIYRIEKLFFTENIFIHVGIHLLKVHYNWNPLTTKVVTHSFKSNDISNNISTFFFTKWTLTCFLRTCRVIQPSIDKQKNLLLIRNYH